MQTSAFDWKLGASFQSSGCDCIMCDINLLKVALISWHNAFNTLLQVLYGIMHLCVSTYSPWASTSWCMWLLHSRIIFNPRRACARVMVVVMCVSVCLTMLAATYLAYAFWHAYTVFPQSDATATAFFLLLKLVAFIRGKWLLEGGGKTFMVCMYVMVYLKFFSSSSVGCLHYPVADLRGSGDPRVPWKPYLGWT